MRVFPNNDGSELVFTLYCRPPVSDQEFAEDAESVEKDLAKLAVGLLQEKGVITPPGLVSRQHRAKAWRQMRVHEKLHVSGKWMVLAVSIRRANS